ncbi:GNAT family N-acetyltransferase [Actinotalea ferrariae]|uniref:GNAT family N-acetyltransferase n=1 Tax=Actinotalea ferrariae TaxID=1386098 RepID=UPI001C8C1BB4|nr:GNAT family N-acetyltransferase [Actinotalea ferrariae]MBX9246185.1 GNAT family N-acetyltransferase [Actinotalea ferrariae]
MTTLPVPSSAGTTAAVTNDPATNDQATTDPAATGPGAPAIADGPSGVEIVEVLAAELDSPDAWAIHGTVLLERATHLDTVGDTDLALDAGTTRATLLDPYRRMRRFVAVRDASRSPESVVGRAMVALPQVGNAHVAQVYVGVHPEWRGRGIGSALWDAVVALAREAGRTVLHADAEFSPEPPPGPGALEAPTGSGRIPADHPSTRFLLARGMRLEQVARHSVLDLPVPPEHLRSLHDDAAAAAGDAYRVHVWHDEVPDRWVDDVARLETRMSTDAPSGDLDVTEDPWDAARVRSAEEQIHERGQRYVLAAAEHVATGTLAGFSMVTYPEADADAEGDDSRPAFQEDTLVLREHRGHRLGMLVKTSMLAELDRRSPRTRRLHTWNAEENAPMLAINVALGFRPAGVDAEWEGRL